MEMAPFEASKPEVAPVVTSKPDVAPEFSVGVVPPEEGGVVA